MPRYFFNVHNVSPSVDDLGEALPDDEAAWQEVTLLVGDVIKDLDGKFRPGQRILFEVIDENGKPVYSIHIEADRTK
jgi:hypothetical protein